MAPEFENKVWLLDDMLGILKKEVESKERSILVGTSFDEKPFDKNKHFEFDYSSAALFKSENRTDKKPFVFCRLLNHKSIKYLKESNPAARKEICKKSRLCFTYFDKNHNASGCTWDYNSKHCGGKRNIAMVLLIKISYLDYAISLHIIWQIIKPTFYCKQPW